MEHVQSVYDIKPTVTQNFNHLLQVINLLYFVAIGNNIKLVFHKKSLDHLCKFILTSGTINWTEIVRTKLNLCSKECITKLQP